MDKIEVKNLRNSVDMTQEEFARFLDVAVSTVRNWEQGRAPVAPIVGDGIKARVKAISKAAA